uniref:Uncharacterized protein n=1 Tax=Kalanchoe fedtschenkoi TaxID=63787 RepID=A0A7N0V1H7_KALFE
MFGRVSEQLTAMFHRKAFLHCFWIERSLSEKNRVLLRSNTKLIVECMMPDLLHIIPVADNTMLDGVLQCEDTSLRLGFVTDICILLSHTNHDTSVSWSTNYTGENCPGCIITSKPSLHHTGTIVTNKRLNVFTVSHLLQICRETEAEAEATAMRWWLVRPRELVVGWVC